MVKDLLQQLLLLLLLFLGQLLSLVDLPLLLALDLLGVGPEVGVERDLVADRLPIVVDFLVEKLEQARREELEILHDRLLGRSEAGEKNDVTVKLLLFHES